MGSFSWFNLKNRCNKARLLIISDRYITHMTRLVPCEVLEQPSQVEHAIIFVCWSTATSQVDWGWVVQIATCEIDNLILIVSIVVRTGRCCGMSGVMWAGWQLAGAGEWASTWRCQGTLVGRFDRDDQIGAVCYHHICHLYNTFTTDSTKYKHYNYISKNSTWQANSLCTLSNSSSFLWNTNILSW